MMPLQRYQEAYRAIILDGVEMEYIIVSSTGIPSTVRGTVYGELGMHESKLLIYTVDHIPTGRAINVALLRDEALDLIRALLFCGANMSAGSMVPGTRDYARVGVTLRAWREGRVPQWWTEREKLRSDTL